MRAALVSNDPTAQVLSVEEVPTPALAPGCVLIEIHRAALNRLDAMMLTQRHELDRPTIFGSDGAGIVVQVGPGVQTVDVGSHVIISPSLNWGHAPEAPGADYEILGAPTDGTHAQYVAIPAENAYDKPDRLSWSEAAALPMAGVTAWRALVTRGRLVHGETVVIPAASAGVGSIAIQVAKGLSMAPPGFRPSTGSRSTSLAPPWAPRPTSPPSSTTSRRPAGSPRSTRSTR